MIDKTGTPWTMAEVRHLAQLWAEGRSWKFIAAQLGRSVRSVESARAKHRLPPRPGYRPEKTDFNRFWIAFNDDDATALKAAATAAGMSVSGYVRMIVRRDLKGKRQ